MRISIVKMASSAALGLVAVFLATNWFNGSTSVPLQSKGDAYFVPIRINDAATLDFAVDSGSSVVTIPDDTVQTLIRLGAMSESDFLGSEPVILADGSTTTEKRIRIRSLKVGEKLVTDVRGSVAPAAAPPLLGRTFLKRFKSWAIDNARRTLVLGDMLSPVQPQRNAAVAAQPSSLLIGAEERRRQVQSGQLPLVGSYLMGPFKNINAADQAIELQAGYSRLPSNLADIVESEETWWWEPEKTNPNVFRMYVRNPYTSAIVGLLLKIQAGKCDPNILWDYFFLRFPSPLEANRAGVLSAEMPYSDQFPGCAIVIALYAAPAE